MTNHLPRYLGISRIHAGTILLGEVLHLPHNPRPWNSDEDTREFEQYAGGLLRVVSEYRPDAATVQVPQPALVSIRKQASRIEHDINGNSGIDERKRRYAGLARSLEDAATSHMLRLGPREKRTFGYQWRERFSAEARRHGLVEICGKAAAIAAFHSGFGRLPNEQRSVALLANGKFADYALHLSREAPSLEVYSFNPESGRFEKVE